jgi:hypothetical protein
MVAKCGYAFGGICVWGYSIVEAEANSQQLADLQNFHAKRPIRQPDADESEATNLLEVQ